MDSVEPVNDFLAGGGEMGALTRAFDWSKTSLGPPETWPQSLRVTVRLVLNSGHPMFIWWGPELIQFYNDAYRATMGPERHPSALGARGRECWDEIWDIIGPQIELRHGRQGIDLACRPLVPVTRHGRREDVWWTYSYGPIDLDGKVGGVLVVCNDVTSEHRAQGRAQPRQPRTAAPRQKHAGRSQRRRVPDLSRRVEPGPRWKSIRAGSRPSDGRTIF